MKKTFHIIRHGVTPWNQENRCMGQQDIPLNPTGEAQASALAVAFAATPLDRILCSDLSRTRQTAQPLADATGLPIELDPRLREINYGILEGSCPDEWPTRFPELMRTWEYGSMDQAPPGGESRRELMQRCAAVLEACTLSDATHFAIVTHGGVVMALLTWMIFHAMQETPRHSLGLFKIHNASITSLSWTPERWRILAVNQPAAAFAPQP